eukprot:362772-Chlamydomonas_euryale.AAC.7
MKFHISDFTPESAEHLPVWAQQRRDETVAGRCLGLMISLARGWLMMMPCPCNTQHRHGQQIPSSIMQRMLKLGAPCKG